MECGKKKMLRKCEFQGLPSIVATIHTMGNRIFVGDAHESFHYMRYKKAENAFYIFADDSTPRCTTPSAASSRSSDCIWRCQRDTSLTGRSYPVIMRCGQSVSRCKLR